MTAGMGPVVNSPTGISFARGRLECECGAVVRGNVPMPYYTGSRSSYLALAGTPEALAGAFQQHRREVGAGNAAPNLATGESPVFVARKRAAA